MPIRELKGCSIIDFPQDYIIIDIETTGLDSNVNKIIEISALKVRNNEIVDTFTSLVNPGVKLDSFIVNLTGITDEMLSTERKITDVIPLFYDFIGNDILVGHNVNFDINFLYDNMLEVMSLPLRNDYIDTLRVSKKYLNNVPNYKLTTLAACHNISCEGVHRSLADCYIVLQLFKVLMEEYNKLTDELVGFLNAYNPEQINPFNNKMVAIKGTPQIYSYRFIEKLAAKCNFKITDVFYQSVDYIVFSHFTYKKYIEGDESEKFIKANRLAETGSLKVLSEEQFYDLLNVPYRKYNNSSSTKSYVRAKDVTASNYDFDKTHPLYNKVCVFTGVLEKMARKDAMQIVADYGGTNADSVTSRTNYLILGNNDFCSSIKDGKSTKQKKAESLILKGQDLLIISENVFYDMVDI